MKTVYARTQDYHLLNGHLITLPCWLNSVVSLVSVGRPPCLLVMATIFTTVCSRHPFPLKVELSLLNTLGERQDKFGHTDLHQLNPFRLSQKWGDSNRGCVFLISYPIRFDTEEQLWSGPHDNKHPGSFSGPLFLSTHAFHRELDLLWGFISWASVECSQTSPSAYCSYDSQMRDEKEIQFIVLKLGPSEITSADVHFAR